MFHVSSGEVQVNIISSQTSPAARQKIVSSEFGAATIPANHTWLQISGVEYFIQLFPMEIGGC